MVLSISVPAIEPSGRAFESLISTSTIPSKGAELRLTVAATRPPPAEAKRRDSRLKPATKPIGAEFERRTARPGIVAAFPSPEQLRPGVHNPRFWYPDRPVQTVWRSLRDQVLMRDNWACMFCGHRASKWMQIHHLGDSSDHSLANLGTICVACHAVLHTGMNLTLGTIEIWASDISQVEIVRQTRAGIRSGRTLDEIKRELPLRRGPLAPRSMEYANAVVRSMGDAPHASLPEPLSAVFVRFQRWQIGDEELR